MSNSHCLEQGDAIAIIGMACRLPGARQTDEFWQNLRAGVESITFFSDEQMLELGADADALANPYFVNAGARVDDIDLFDADFFGYNPREAELIDPQQRVLLECAWEAIERAGYDPDRFKGSIGVFAGAGINAYLLLNIASNPNTVKSAGEFQTVISNDK